MADRKQTLKISAPVPSFPSIQVAVGRASAFQGIAKVLGRVADDMHDQADRRAVLEATRAGSVAGATGTPTLREDQDTLAGAAFNQSARQSFTNRLDLMARSGLAGLAAKHKADPAGFSKAATGYVDGLIQQAGTVAPDIAAIAKAKLEIEIASQTTQIKETYFGLLTDARKGEALVLTDRIMKDLKKTTPDLLSGDPDKGLLAIERIGAERDRLRTVLLGVRPDGLPMFKPAEIAAGLIGFDDSVIDMAIRGAADQAENKNQFYNDLLTGKAEMTVDLEGKAATVNPLDLMSRKAQERVINYAQALSNTESRAKSGADAAARAERRAQENRTRSAFFKALDDGTFSRAWFNANTEDMDPSTNEIALKALRGGGALEDDKPTAMALITALGVEGDDQAMIDTAYLDDRITLESYERYSSINAQHQRQDGPAGVFRRNMEFMKGLIADTKTLDYADLSGVQGAILEFQEWWKGFPSLQVEGQPLNREPTSQEAKAKVRELLLDQLGRSPRASIVARSVNSAFSEVPSLTVADPKDAARIDVTATRDRINRNFGIMAKDDVGKLTGAKRDEYLAEIRKLNAYQKADQEFRAIIQRIDTYGQ